MVRTLALALAFLVVVGPWSLKNILRYGDLNNLNHLNIAFALFDTRSSWLKFDSYAEQFPSLLSLIVAHPGAMFRHLAKNAFHFPEEVLFRQGLLAGVFSVLGMMATIRRPSLERVSLQLNGALLVAATLLTWFDPRFYVPVLPIVMLFAAKFMLSELDKKLASYLPEDASGASVFGRLPLRGTAVLLCIAVAAAGALARIPGEYREANVADEKRVGEFLSENTPDSAPVLTSSRNLAWYASRPYVRMYDLGDVTSDNLADAVAKTNAAIFVYTSRHSTFSHPQLKYRLSPEDERVPETFRVIYKQDDGWPVIAYAIER